MSLQKFGQYRSDHKDPAESEIPSSRFYFHMNGHASDSSILFHTTMAFPNRFFPLFFFKDPDQPMTDAKFEELACFNCMSPGAILLFPSINSAIQAYNGSTEFGSIRPLLSSSRRSKLNKEAQKQRSHTVIHEVGFGSLKKGRIFHHDINIRDSRFCAKFFTVTRQ